MAAHEADEHARVAEPLVERRVTQQKRLLRCQLCRIYGHDASTRKVRSAAGRNYSQRSRPLKNGEGAAGCLRGRKKAAPSIPPTPINSLWRRTAPQRLHPIFRIARII
ncbi:surface protease GP63 [Trypanosoma cruzi]|nr:surface protease GP63 [Trypanosoma cruzi]